MEVSKKTQQRIALIMGAILLLVLASIIYRQLSPGFLALADEQSAKAETENDNQPDSDEVNKTESQTTNQSESVQTDTDTYSFVAKPGDSYTVLARQLVARYTEENDIAITPIDALMAEIELANKAGSPELEVGQKVSLSTDDLVSVLSAYYDQEEHADTAKPETKTNETDQADKIAAEPADAPDPGTTPPTAAAVNYTYTAQPDDSYTTLARDATRKYADTHDIDLSPAQRLYVETHLAVMANSPMIEVGEQVVFTESNLATYVKQASQLSLDQQSNWKIYLPASGL